jgi:hypothetical protein
MNNYMRECWKGSLEVGSLGRLDNQESLDTLNRGLADLTNGTFINPFTAINKIKNYLAIAGLSFDSITDLPVDRGTQTSSGKAEKNSKSISGQGFFAKSISLPLRWHNGPKGMKKDGKYHEEDESSWTLQLSYSKTRGSWTVSSTVAPSGSSKILGEKKEEGGYEDAHRKLVDQGYKPVGGGKYKDPRDPNRIVRLHGQTKQVYQVKEDMDPVRDMFSRKTLLGKIKGVARDAVKGYKNRLKTGQAAAKAEYKRIVPAAERVKQGEKVTESKGTSTMGRILKHPTTVKGVKALPRKEEPKNILRPPLKAKSESFSSWIGNNIQESEMDEAAKLLLGSRKGSRKKLNQSAILTRKDVKSHDRSFKKSIRHKHK